MNRLMAGRMEAKWGMDGDKMERMWSNPLFLVGSLFHLVMTVLLFLILLLLAMYLWERVKALRNENRKLSKSK